MTTAKTSEVQEQEHPHACWSGQVFIGHIDEDGEEVIEAIRCKRCQAEEEGAKCNPSPMQ
jgi:hypothetical protein